MSKSMSKTMAIMSAALMISAGSAFAQYSDNNFSRPQETSFGPRVGFSVDPDQIVIGPSLVVGPLMEYVYFAPSLDFGFGDDMTAIAVNPDLRLRLFSPYDSRWVFFVGAGPTIAILSPEGGDSDTEVGLSLTTGIKFPFGMRNYGDLEARIGLGDIPEVKVMFGLMFGSSYERSTAIRE